MDTYQRFLSLALLILMIALAACSTPEQGLQDRVDKAMNEDFEYSEFSNEGFSIKYPMWPAAEGDVELSVSRGYCSFAVNTEKIPADQWHDMMIDAVDKQEGRIIDSDQEEGYVKYSMPYQNFTMISENRIYECKGNSNAVTVTCIEQAYDNADGLRNTIFSSARCEGKEITGTKAQSAGNAPQKEETSYETYNDMDFSVEYPDWENLKDNSSHAVGVSAGICSVVIDKHNALPGDIYKGYRESVESDSSKDLIDSSSGKDAYFMTYDMPYEDMTIISEAKILYCNYQTYVTQVLCVDSLITDKYESIREKVMQSSECAREYDVPTPKKVEEARKEVEENDPEAIEDVKDEIVKTHAGDEFGIDEEAVVYFINSNDFFTRIMKDFPKANIVIEDSDNGRELDLRVIIDDEGKITLVEDGSFSDADVTLKVPLRDALNIFGNAQNINPMTLIGFAANVQTEPSSIKNEVIQKVLKGEYS
ncbi:hypothetical protein GF345_05150 [Candidatus Woesearchaeota archaeon]|nr:hypothetical protein [Candidatus Woesearchaeota archaeon]